jgi:hypothetical protein
MKLKLANCESIPARRGFFVGWVELIRAFTPVFAGYAKPINRRRWVSQELNPSYKGHQRFIVVYNVRESGPLQSGASFRSAVSLDWSDTYRSPTLCPHTHRAAKSITAVICKFVVPTKLDQSPRLFAESLFFQWSPA